MIGLDVADFEIVNRRNIRWAAYSAGVNKYCGCAAASAAGPWGGCKNLLTLKEKRSFLGKESFYRGQIDNNIIRLNIAKIGVNSSGQLKIGTGAPECVEAGLVIISAGNDIVVTGRVGVESKLSARFKVAQDDGLQGAEELGLSAGQRRPTPVLALVTDLP